MDVERSDNSGGSRGTNDTLSLGATMAGGTHSPSHTVYVTIPQSTTANGKGIFHFQKNSESYSTTPSTINVQSVIQQPQQSVIQSTALQTVQLSKSGGVFLLKHPSNSVIQSPGSNNLQAVQVLNAENLEDQIEPSRKRQILARRPSYKKILNDLSGGEISEKGDPGSSDSSQDETSVSGTTTITLGGQHYQTAVIPASSLQLSSGQAGETLQTIAMTNPASGGNAIVHYAPGNSEGQLIVPVYNSGLSVATSDLSSLKIATTAGNVSQGVVLTATTGSAQIHSSNDNMAEEATRKREIRLMKNREAARECRAKKKEYIKCLENRVAVLENQNRTLIEELKTLKSLYGLNDVKE
ncbi:Cyclic AMP-responsive element-binding protein 1 [Armadillidium vulgare]|nr:Cyclic AMP-responsive element-binding protein 1 [Armadillidium vulgare]